MADETITIAGLTPVGLERYGEILNILQWEYGYTYWEAENWIVELIKAGTDPFTYFPIAIDISVRNLSSDLDDMTYELGQEVNRGINTVSDTMSDVYNFVVDEVTEIYSDVQVGYDILWDNVTELYDDWATGSDYIYDEVTTYITGFTDDWTVGMEYLYDEVETYTTELYDDWTTGIDYIYTEITDYTDELQDDWTTGIDYIYDQVAINTEILYDDWLYGIDYLYDEVSTFIGNVDSTFTEQIDNFMVYFDMLAEDGKEWMFGLLDIDESTLNRALDYMESIQEKILNKIKDRM